MIFLSLSLAAVVLSKSEQQQIQAAAKAWSYCVTSTAIREDDGKLPEGLQVGRGLKACEDKESEFGDVAFSIMRRRGNPPAAAGKIAAEMTSQASDELYAMLTEELKLYRKVNALPPQNPSQSQEQAAAPSAPIPIGDPNNWFSSDDYPMDALRADAQGSTWVTLAIDTSGRAIDCNVTQSSGWSSLDSATCQIIRRRARFKPARNANGTVTNGTFRTGYRWSLE